MEKRIFSRRSLILERQREGVALGRGSSKGPGVFKHPIKATREFFRPLDAAADSVALLSPSRIGRKTLSFRRRL